MKATDYTLNQDITLQASGLKNDAGIADVLFFESRYDFIHMFPRKARIEKIVTGVTIEQAKNNTFAFGEGGTISDIEVSNIYNLSDKEKDNLRSLVTLVELEDGRFFFVDAQGYDYPRYLLFADDAETMFADIIEEARQKDIQYREERKALLERECEHERYNNMPFVDKMRVIMSADKRGSYNIKNWVKKTFPMVKIASVKSDKYYDSVYVYLNESDEQISAIDKRWEEESRSCLMPYVKNTYDKKGYLSWSEVDYEDKLLPYGVGRVKFMSHLYK